MTIAIGRNVRVEIGSTEGASKTVTIVTSAKPPVATSTAHTLLVKTLGYFATAAGMPQLVGQAVRFSAVDANTLTLEDLDATGYGTFTSGTLIPITAWATIATATDVNIGGGGASPIDTTVLLDQIKQQVSGPLEAQTVNISLRNETISPAGMQKIREVARVAGYLVFRLTYSDGNVRFFRGQPSLPTEQVGTGTPASGSFDVTVQGFVCEGVA